MNYQNEYNFMACVISTLPFLFFIYVIINIIILRGYSILYIIGFIFTGISTEILKKTPYEKLFNLQKYNNLCYRPKGAHDCDFLSTNGLEKDNIRAMPSSHMAITAYFVAINILFLLKYDNIPLKTVGIMANLILLISMAWARTYKLCHNKYQVIFGSIYGSIVGGLFYNVLC